MQLADHDLFWFGMSMIAVAIAFTIFVFRRRLFDWGDRQGEAADPDAVRRQNPPDWRDSHS